MGSKKILVVVATPEPARANEALRAALGLSLRGDQIAVCWLGAAAPALHTHAAIARSLATLAELGHDIDAAVESIRGAAAVEVWT